MSYYKDWTIWQKTTNDLWRQTFFFDDCYYEIRFNPDGTCKESGSIVNIKGVYYVTVDDYAQGWFYNEQEAMNVLHNQIGVNKLDQILSDNRMETYYGD